MYDLSHRNITAKPTLRKITIGLTANVIKLAPTHYVQYVSHTPLYCIMLPTSTYSVLIRCNQEYCYCQLEHASAAFYM